MKSQRKAGALLTYLNIIANLIVGLVYTPIMLRLLGQAEYGLYSLLGSMVGYLSILDLGLGNTMVRYTAANRANGDRTREAKLNGLFLCIYLVISLVAITAGFILYFNLDVMFGAKLTAEELGKARAMTILLIVNLAFTFPLSIFGSVIQAYERFVFLRLVNIIRTLINPCLVIPFLMMGYGSVMIVAVTTLLNLSCLLSNVWYCFKYLHIKFRIGHYSSAFIKEVSAYSFFIFLNAVMDKIYWGTGQFVLGITRGTVDVAIYAVAVQFLMMYMQFSTAISGVLLPKVTMMVTNGASKYKLSVLFIKIGRLQFIIIGYILSSFVIFGQEFISLWAGDNYSSAYPMIILLMGAMFIPLIQNAGIAILQAMRLNRYRMTVYSVVAFLDLFISFPLAYLWGGFGCAIGTSGALFISTGIIMNRYYGHTIGLDIAKFWKEILNMATGPALLLLVIIVFNYYFPAPYSWGHFIKFGVLYTLVYGTVLFVFSFNDYEKGLLKSLCLRLHVK